jgi:O-antigen/teichoic acid export membrane protein
MSERRRNALLAMVFGYVGLIISLARNILFVPMYLQKIPLAEYGAWLATGGALALILINDYGLSGVVTQRISVSFGAGDLGVLGELAGSALAIGALVSLALCALSLLFVPFLPGLGGLTPPDRHTVVVCFALAVAANGLGVIGATAGSVIRSLQKPVLGGSIVLCAELANVLVILAGLLAGYGLYAIAAALLVRSVIITVAGLIGVWFVCARTLGARIEVRVEAVRDLVGEASRFFLSSIAMRLQSQANVFFVGAILGPASAAIYSLTVRAHETVGMLMSLVNGSLVPSVTHLYGSGNILRFRAVVLRLLVALSALTGLSMTLTVVLNADFLRLWVGRYAFGGQSVSIPMAAALFVCAIGYIAYDALLAQGQFRFVSRVFFLTSMLQVLLLVALLRWGLWIAPATTMITACVWGFAFWKKAASHIALTRHDSRGLVEEILRIGGVSTAVAVGFLRLYPSANSWTALVVEGALCGVCLAGGYLAFSPRLRGIAYEEMGTTLRAFRAT